MFTVEISERGTGNWTTDWEFSSEADALEYVDAMTADYGDEIDVRIAR